MEVIKKKSNIDTQGILSLTVKFGEGIDVGDVRIAIDHKSCGEARIYIKAPRTTRIERWRVLPNCTNRFDKDQTTTVPRSASGNPV